MNVASPTAAGTKWVQRASAAAQTYTTAVATSNVDQAGLAAAAQPLWAAGVQQAAANGTFANAVQKAGTAAWKAGVAAKGSARYPGGVTAGQPKYQTNVAPYFAALSNLQLPARGVKGSNIGRVTAVDDALMAVKQTNG